MNYKYLYEQLIKNARVKNNFYDSSVHHKHHIKPRCLGGQDNESNLVILTHREHFLAHLILCKIFKSNRKLRFALNAMYNLHGLKKSRTSRQFAEHMKLVASYLSDFHTNKVYARTKDNTLICVTKEEFASNNDLIFHTKGMIRCHDITGRQFYVTSEEFQNSDKLFHHTNSPIEELRPKFLFYDCVENIEIKLTKQDAKNLNLIYRGFCLEQKLKIIKKRYKQIQNKPKISLSKELRNKPEYYRQKGEVVAFDKTLNIWKTITKKEFKNKEKYVGASKGMITAFDKVEGKFVKISRRDLDSSERYVGNNKNKINVININTGVRRQCLKHEIDKNEIYLSFKNLLISKGWKNSLHYIEWKLNINNIQDKIKLTNEQVEYYENYLCKILHPIVKERKISKKEKALKYYYKNNNDVNLLINYCKNELQMTSISYILKQIS